MNYNKLGSKESVEKTVKALKEKGYNVFVFENGSEALEKIKEIIPKGVSVMNGASESLRQIGYLDFLKSGKNPWLDLHTKVNSENDPVKKALLRKEAVLSDFYLGSVHALTEEGLMIIASNSGTQLPNIVSTSQNLVLVIGTQKIVANIDTAMKRLENYVVPLEDGRLRDLYGISTSVNKIVIFRGENLRLGRKINIILVKENLGF